MNHSQALYCHHALEVVTLSNLRKIAKHHEPVWLWDNGTATDYRALGIDKHLAALIVQQKQSTSVDQLLLTLFSKGSEVIAQASRDYPRQLKQLYRPPALLYCRGSWREFRARKLIAIVGTRKMTDYGKRATINLIKDLAGANVAIISGGALGIDATALECCLAFKIPCGVILGSGIDQPTPASNQALFNKIIANHGIIISEYLPWQPANKSQFPQRNRIISGLTEIVVVIEAPERSGALITADFALQQGREVAAVPGPITNPHWTGSNQLIKTGAQVITRTADILELIAQAPT